MSFDTYHKIYGPFKRATEGPDRNKVIYGEWYRPEYEALQYNNWIWTEKLDGTNIRVHWDGHKVTFGGRTDRAQLPGRLVEHLNETFKEELFEQTFQGNEVTLFGEGVGSGIQKVGGNYGADQKFILFDVKVGDWWLQRNSWDTNKDSVKEVAHSLGIPVAPIKFVGEIWSAVRLVEDGVKSDFGDFYAEGLVGIPDGGFLSRSGERIALKVKHVDFYKGEIQ